MKTTRFELKTVSNEHRKSKTLRILLAAFQISSKYNHYKSLRELWKFVDLKSKYERSVRGEQAFYIQCKLK